MNKKSITLVVAATSLAVGLAFFLLAPKPIKNPKPSKVEVIGRLIKSIPTYKTVPSGPIRLIAEPEDEFKGLPESLKDEIALALRVPLGEIYDDFLENYIKYDVNVDSLSVSIKSAPVALVDESIDGILVWIEAPYMCGSGGCWTTLYHRQDKAWRAIGEFFGCAQFDVLDVKTYGLKDIRLSECHETTDSFTIKFNGESYR